MGYQLIMTIANGIIVLLYTTLRFSISIELESSKLLGPCKRTQYCWPKIPNNTQQCCDLLRPFPRALKGGGGAMAMMTLDFFSFSFWKLNIKEESV